MTLKMGDIIKTDFLPTNGHEQRGYRLAMIVSANEVYAKTGIVWIAPITSATDKFPTHIPLNTKNGVITGTVLCEYVKSIDPNVHSYEHVDEATDITLLRCKQVLDAITHI